MKRHLGLIVDTLIDGDDLNLAKYSSSIKNFSNITKYELLITNHSAVLTEPCLKIFKIFPNPLWTVIGLIGY